MALERRNPLPPGRYWIDLFPSPVDGKPDGREHFAEWSDRHNDAVHVETTQSFDSDPPRTFVIFKTFKDLPWGQEMGTVVGFPTIAGKEVQASEDTVQRPPPEETAPPTFFEGIGKVILWTAGGVVALGALSILYSYLKRKAEGG